MTAPKPFTTGQAMDALEKLERRWPDHLALFSWSGTMLVVDKRVRTDSSSALNTAAIVGIVSISNDGGDPDQIDDGEYEWRSGEA